MSIYLADLGGTHLRLARADNHADIKTFKIADFRSFEELLQQNAPDIQTLYLASAVHPIDHVIEDKRFGDKSHWVIHLKEFSKKLGLKKIKVLNDLEAGAYGLNKLSPDSYSIFLPAKRDDSHFEEPPKLLISIGTGIGHAYLIQKGGNVPIVQRSHGGHMPAIAMTDEQREVVNRLQKASTKNRDIIVEDIVSGSGVATMRTILPPEDSLRLFWEFLGLYCNILVSAAVAYGGVYLTGGVCQDMISRKMDDVQSFEKFFRRPMVPVVTESLAATPVYHVHHENLAIYGLSTLVENA